MKRLSAGYGSSMSNVDPPVEQDAPTEHEPTPDDPQEENAGTSLDQPSDGTS